MATVVTLTKISGPATIQGIGVECIYTCALDTTTAAGIMTCDLTDDFKYVLFGRSWWKRCL